MKKQKNIKLSFETTSGKKPQSEFPVNHGESSFDTFKELPGNENKTLQEFHEYLRGKDGDGVVGVVAEVIVPEPEVRGLPFSVDASETVNLSEYKQGDTVTLIPNLEEYTLDELREFNVFTNMSGELQGSVMVSYDEGTNTFTGGLEFFMIPNVAVSKEQQNLEMVFGTVDFDVELGDVVSEVRLKLPAVFKPEYLLGIDQDYEIKVGLIGEPIKPTLTEIATDKPMVISMLTLSLFQSNMAMLINSFDELDPETSGLIQFRPYMTEGESIPENNLESNYGRRKVNSNISVIGEDGQLIVMPFEMTLSRGILPENQADHEVTVELIDQTAFGNNYNFSGVVLDKEGKPIVGAVVNSHHSSGVMLDLLNETNTPWTDAEGKYKVKGNAGAFIGNELKVEQNVQIKLAGKNTTAKLEYSNKIKLARIQPSVTEEEFKKKPYQTFDITMAFTDEGGFNWTDVKIQQNYSQEQPLIKDTDVSFTKVRAMQNSPIVSVTIGPIDKTEESIGYMGSYRVNMY